MPIIQLENDKTYGDVLYQLLYKIGGVFHGRPERVLVLSDWQLKALQEAGLVQENGKKRKDQHGKEEK